MLKIFHKTVDSKYILPAAKLLNNRIQWISGIARVSLAAYFRIMKQLILTGLLISAGLTGFTMQAQAQRKSAMLNHIAISVVDLDKSTAFYRDIVGIDTMPEPFHDGKHTWFKVAEHAQLHLIKGAKEVNQHDIGSHLCFSVPSVEEFITRLNKHNIPFINWQGEKQKYTLRVDGVKQLYIQDPDNYWVEINDDKY